MKKDTSSKSRRQAILEADAELERMRRAAHARNAQFVERVDIACAEQPRNATDAQH